MTHVYTGSDLGGGGSWRGRGGEQKGGGHRIQEPRQNLIWALSPFGKDRILRIHIASTSCSDTDSMCFVRFLM